MKHSTRTPKSGNILAKPRASLPAHILVAETISRFGRDPLLLKPRSCRPVIVRCTVCGETREKQFRQAVEQKTCQRCANKARSEASAAVRSLQMKLYYANGGKHPMTGRKQSAKACAALANARNGHVVSEETRAKLSRAMLARPPITEAGRLKLRQTAPRGPANHMYGKAPAHAKKVWVTDLAGTRVCMRSTWEAAFADYLTGKGIQWTYEPKAFPVVYLNKVLKWVQATYRPDFKLGNHLWYEVKGRWLEEARYKFDAFVRQYPKEHIHVIDRAWLKEQKLLPKRVHKPTKKR